METAGCDSSRPLAEQVAQRIKDYILEEKLKSGILENFTFKILFVRILFLSD